MLILRLPTNNGPSNATGLGFRSYQQDIPLFRATTSTGTYTSSQWQIGYWKF
jgi:hypothetical protein